MVTTQGPSPAAENTANGEIAIQDTPSLESTLIDLADLNFATTTTPTGGGGQSIGSFLDTLPPGGYIWLHDEIMLLFFYSCCHTHWSFYY